MQLITERAVAAAASYEALMESIAEAFRAGATMPARQHYTVRTDDGDEVTLLLMPCWQSSGSFGVKLVTVCPGNADRGLPTVQAAYLLGDLKTGAVSAAMDAGDLTQRRTAATSALAARHLSLPNARTLLMVGCGRLATHLVRAHCTARDIERVLIWGRSPSRATAMAARVGTMVAADVRPVADLGMAIHEADIISCATTSRDPLVHGRRLRPGQHLDLVGSYQPSTREADDEALRRSKIVVDSRDAAFTEAGDLMIPLANGTICRDDVHADLAEIVRGERPGRESTEEITLFKSVGLALEDLAAARLVAMHAGATDATG